MNPRTYRDHIAKFNDVSRLQLDTSVVAFAGSSSEFFKIRVTDTPLKTSKLNSKDPNLESHHFYSRIKPGASESRNEEKSGYEWLLERNVQSPFIMPHLYRGKDLSTAGFIARGNLLEQMPTFTNFDA